jgi:hypothetical protein
MSSGGDRVGVQAAIITDDFIDAASLETEKMPFGKSSNPSSPESLTAERGEFVPLLLIWPRTVNVDAGSRRKV